MIPVTRLNGTRFAVNCDLIERCDASPDTVICLVDGTKYLVQESIDEIISAIRAFRASVVQAAAAAPHAGGHSPLRIVSSPEES